MIRLIAALCGFAVLASIAALPYIGGIAWAAGHESSKFLSTKCDISPTPPPQKTTIYANDGKTVIANLFEQDRIPVPLSQVPKALQQALVATEDRRFYDHHGVDLRGLIRSAVSTSGGNTQGGSTLTMQYVKQIRYYAAIGDSAKQQAAIAQNLDRKMEDARCALYFENDLHMSKGTILDNYLNIAFFGENSYGIQSAAQRYFGKNSADLTVPEGALLVGVLRAPTEYDPFVHPQAAKDRRNAVLQNMVSMKDLTQKQADAYAKEPIRLATDSAPVVHQGCTNSVSTVVNSGFFCAYVTNWLTSNKILTQTQLATGGYNIVTTLDPNTQNNAQAKMAAALPATSAMTGVLPVMDPKTGDILAMASTKNYGLSTSAQDNTHTVQPIFTSYTASGASTWKLFPLLAALSIGIQPNYALQNLSASTKGDPFYPQQVYKAHNCNDAQETINSTESTYSSVETLQSATVKSSNTYFVALADQLFYCNPQPIVEMAQKLGMQALDQASGEGKNTYAQTIVNDRRLVQLVLGNVPTSPLELTAAYAAVADDGTYHAPLPVLSITKADGSDVKFTKPAAKQVIYPYVARQAIAIMSGDTTQALGTARATFSKYWKGSVVAGKTGTAPGYVGTNGNFNGALWFVGMTPSVVATSAVINFDQSSAAASDLPGVADPSTQAYGAYASGIWAQALSPTLGTTKWTWPSATSAPGSQIPTLTTLTTDAASAQLAAKGFKMVVLDQAAGLQCGSAAPYGSVATGGPLIAPAGATITVCLSNGFAPNAGTPATTAAPSRTGATTPTTQPTQSGRVRGGGNGGGVGNSGGPAPN